jgi:multidrug efflux system membrane fusion protein
MRQIRVLRQLRSSRPAAGLAGALLLAVLTASCSSGAASDAAGATGRGSGRGGRGDARGGGRGAAGGVVAVTTAAAVEKPMAVNVRAVGNVEATSTVEVRAQVAGELMEISFNEGQEVTAGQLLFTIDPKPFEVALQQVQAQLARDTAQAKGAQAQLARADDLFSRGLQSKADHEAISTQVAALNALVASDNAQVANAQLQLDRTKITAPVSGRTGALLVHRGSLIRANDTTPLVVINQIAPAYVSFAVPAKLLPQLTRGRANGGLTVRANPAGVQGDPATGTVSFIDNAVDPSTDTVRIKATFNNRDHRLWPGAFADVVLQLSVDQHAIVVPEAAPQTGQQGDYVFVVKPDQTVESRPIAIGWTEAGETVVASGLRPGETVVTDGQLRLTPGARITVKTADTQPKGQQP